MQEVLESLKSTHKVEVVPVSLTRHPNADSLSVIPVYGYTFVGRTEDWQGVTRGAYVPPDSLVSVDRPEFSFLAAANHGKPQARIKAKRLRGVVSYGLLIPVPNDTPLGEDWADRLGVTHYEPPAPGESGTKAGFRLGGEAGPPPSVLAPKYDMDAFLRYHYLFQPGESIVVTEKLDGCNARYVYHDGRMYCGSRTEWKKEFPSFDHITVTSLVERGMTPEQATEVLDKLFTRPKVRPVWWEILRRTPPIEKFCLDNPGTVLYGEIFGNTNAIKYGLPEGNRFAAFDVMKDGNFLDFPQFYDLIDTCLVETVPLFMYNVPYDFDFVKEKAEGPSLGHGARLGTIREGVVVKPARERYNTAVGRICFKVVNPTYLEKYR